MSLAANPTAPATGAASDRFARSRLVQGWDADRLAAATAVVAGVGALGNEVAKNLALAGVGRLVLCDPDTVAVTNLSRTVLFTDADVDSPKPLVAAAALRALAPGTTVEARTAELVSGVGLGELGAAGVVMGCLDSVRSRMQLLGRCALVDAPLVDGGTGGWAGEVRVRLRPDEPCYGCGLTAHQRGVSDVPWSCADPPPTGPAASSIVATALVASWMTVAALRILLGEPAPWRLLRIDALGGSTEPVLPTRDPRCPHHEPLPAAEPIDVGHRDTVGTLLAALPADADPASWVGFALPTRCVVCGTEADDAVLSCGVCRAPLRPRLSERLGDADAGTRLCDVGVAPEEILTVRLAEGASVASAEVNRPAGQGGDAAGDQELPYIEIQLSPAEIDDLYTAISTAFPDRASAQQLLRRIGYPRAQMPSFQGDHREAWTEVFFGFEQGAIDAPYVQVLAGALLVYRRNAALVALARRHDVDPDSPTLRTPPQAVPDPLPPTPLLGPGNEAAVPLPEPEPEPTPACHVIVRAADEDERQRAETMLRDLHLEPRSVWSTATAISFEVNSADEPTVRRQLDNLTSVGWTLVPADRPDYLIGNLLVEGPDRRRFRVTDAPAQETFRDIAEEVIADHYPQHDPNGELPTLVEHVKDGQRRSVNPDSTLHDANVQDGDQVRVAYQTNAGAVPPARHEAALIRARNQIRDFATGPTARDIGFELGANASLDQLPTSYDMHFTQRSFALAPGQEELPEDVAEVIEVDRHVVSLQLGPEFPQTPPQLWWMTPILHPNIYPNYPGREARARPHARGLVCLGIIGDTWQDAMDFADLCRMVVEIAAFRNYSPFELVLEPDGRPKFGDDGFPELKGNSYDLRAARWVLANQPRILAMGGEFLFPHRLDRRTYRNVIEEISR